MLLMGCGEMWALVIDPTKLGWLLQQMVFTGGPAGGIDHQPRSIDGKSNTVTALDDNIFH